MRTEFNGEIDATLESADIVTELNARLSHLESHIEDVTYMSFQKVINFFESLVRTPLLERNSELYGLTSIYALLLLSATYDVAIKEIFKSRLAEALESKEAAHNYIGKIFNAKILNRYMTNIRHNTVKDTFQIEIDTHDRLLQQSIATINDLIKTRNDIAHGLDPQSKGHNDLLKALEAVFYYLSCYSQGIKDNF